VNNAPNPVAGSGFAAPSPTVLVGFAEALAAAETVWSLVDAGFQVVAFARKGRPSALHQSRHVVCHDICPPESDLQTSLAELQALLTSMSGDASGSTRILFPLDDKAVWLGSNAQLGKDWLLAGPRGTTATFALNKCVQTQSARDAGFNVPKTLLARTAAEVLAFGAEGSFPVILKASECVPIRNGRLQSCRKWICANSAELESAVKEWGERVPLLVQPFILGTGEGIFGLATPDGIRAWSGHRRLRMMNPQGSGSSACISTAVSEDSKAKVERLIANTGWQGLFMIELLRDQAGTLWFVELNGRPWGSLSLSRRQGLEYPAWQAHLALDAQSTAGQGASSEPGVVCRHVGRELMHILFVLRGPKSTALSAWPSFWTTLGEVGRVRSTDTIYNWRREDPRVFFADCWSTLKSNLFKSRNRE
jgi:hypothetical protein